jgi:hypothetical protein
MTPLRGLPKATGYAGGLLLRKYKKKKFLRHHWQGEPAGKYYILWINNYLILKK